MTSSMTRVLCVICLTCTIFGEVTLGAATLQAQTYGFLKKFMTSFDSSKFSKVVDLGSLSTYRSELSSAKIVVDPKLKSLALYDPSTKTIYLSKDPKKVSSDDSLKFGQTIWHELTHKIEDSHGDIGFADSQAYAERNIEYMTYIADVALPVLERMEKDKKASPETIKKRWEYFLKKVSQVKSLPEIKEYPPDAALMAKWFGFKFDVKKIESFYKKGGGGSLIKEALSSSGSQGSPSPSPVSTASLLGDWNINANNYVGILHITSQTGASFSGTVNIDPGATEQLENGLIAGNKVTFTRMWPNGSLRQDYTGTLSKDASGKWTMKGTFTQNNAGLYQWSATKT